MFVKDDNGRLMIA
jgi:hypothetical protein